MLITNLQLWINKLRVHKQKDIGVIMDIKGKIDMIKLKIKQ